MRPTALRAEIYAGTERPVGNVHEAVTQRDLLSTVREQRCATRTCSRVLQRHTTVSRTLLKSNSLRANGSISARNQREVTLQRLDRVNLTYVVRSARDHSGNGLAP